MTNFLSVTLNDFDYDLPKQQIAQFALPKRTDARLLVLDRKRQTIEHRKFCDLIDYFESGDVLVLNDTKVVPARVFAKRKSGARVEMLLLERLSPSSDWKALVKPSRRIKEGETLMVNGDAQVVVLDAPDHETGIRRIQFSSHEPIDETLNRVGHIPLPPYIDREDAPVDRELYQTVFARALGAVASPTAGLHFDEKLLSDFEAKGVEILYVTLHVSYGTFQPVQVDDLSEHHMYEEYFDVSDEVTERINFAKSDGRRITACGTTVVRTLESTATQSFPAEVVAKAGKTDLFIYPPYEFKIPDRLITNFHLPRSTLLMLTSAFAGHEPLMNAYREAITRDYRFYSYGDAMFIV